MDIAELARRSGLPASTLRYYEEKGLIRSIGRHGLRRVFEAEALQKLALISMARQSGFTLDEIATMFDETGAPDLDRSLFRDKADALDATIENLIAVRDSLRHIANCDADNHWNCPQFRKILEGAISAPRVKQIRVPSNATTKN